MLAAALAAAVALAARAGRAEDPQAKAPAETLEERVRALLDGARPREAIAALEKATATGAGVPAALLVLRGEAKLDLGRTSEARVDLERAAKDKGSAPKARVQLARLEFLHGRDDKARKLLQDAPEDDGFAKQLLSLMDGPFAAAWGDAARVCRGRSKDGDYLIYTDLGCGEDALEKATKVAAEIRAKGGEDVESRLAHALPPCDGVKSCGKLMDTIARAYASVFPLSKDDQLVSRVYVFASHDDYLEFSESALGEDANGTAGFYAPDTRVLVIDAEPDEGQKELLSAYAKDTMFHEGFHQYVRFFVPGIPTWLDEGLAEYFGPSRLVGKGELEVGVVNKKIPDGTTRYETILESIRIGRPLAPRPLKEFVADDDPKFVEGDRGEVNYAQAWSVVHFLLSNDKGKGLVTAFWKALRQGKDAKACFAETFARDDLDALEREWKKHVEGL